MWNTSPIFILVGLTRSNTPAKSEFIDLQFSIVVDVSKDKQSVVGALIEEELGWDGGTLLIGHRKEREGSSNIKKNRQM